jgi:hypothetical protein
MVERLNRVCIDPEQPVNEGSEPEVTFTSAPVICYIPYNFVTTLTEP